MQKTCRDCGEPHHHSPSTLRMGDCKICGNVADHPNHLGTVARSTKLREELIERARAEGKFIHLQYQNIWFSPDDLMRENAAGSWRLHPTNFTLRDPGEELQRLREAVTSAQAAVYAFENRMRGAR